MNRRGKQANGPRWGVALLVGLLALAAGGWLTGCETLKGAGKDLQNLGQAMDDAM